MARKSVHMFWGIVSVLVGALLGFLMARNLLSFRWNSITNADCLWFVAGLVILSAISVYFVWLGKNELQRAGGQEVPKPRFRWGRLLLGFCLAFFSLKGHFAPSPNALKPDNNAQALGMQTATVTLVSVGVLLMALAFSPVKQKPRGEAPSTDVR